MCRTPTDSVCCALETNSLIKTVTYLTGKDLLPRHPISSDVPRNEPQVQAAVAHEGRVRLRSINNEYTTGAGTVCLT